MTMTIERLEAAFPGRGERVLAALHFDLDAAEALAAAFPRTAAWAASCYHPPLATELRMAMFDEAAEGYGVEAIFDESDLEPVATYVNMGDTYDRTIVHDRAKGLYRLMSWGDWMEETGR